MQTHSISELLRQSPFAEQLPQSMLDQLVQISRVCAYPAGTIIFEEGTQHRDLQLICHGRVTLEICVPGRGSVRILSLGVGDLLAWSALLGSGEMTASAVALEDTEVVAVPADKLLALCGRDHEMGFEIMQRLARELARRLLATRLRLLDLFNPRPAPNPANVGRKA